MKLKDSIDALFYAIGLKIKNDIKPKILKGSGNLNYMYIKNSDTDYDASWQQITIQSAGFNAEKTVLTSDFLLQQAQWVDIGLSLTVDAGNYVFTSGITITDQIAAQGNVVLVRLITSDMLEVLGAAAICSAGDSYSTHQASGSLITKITDIQQITTVKLQAYAYIPNVSIKATDFIGNELLYAATYLSYIKV